MNDDLTHEFVIPTHIPKHVYEDFKIIRPIGKGSYGDVYLVTLGKDGPEKALKLINVQDLSGKDKQYFYQEILALSSISNTFIVSLFSYSDVCPFCIATDFSKCGTLHDAILHKPRAPKLDNTQKSVIAMGIAYGMICVHEHHFIHRDLKSANILLDENYLPKISDFGLSIKADENMIIEQNAVGTAAWMAPEMFDGTKHITNKADVYSFGIILWEMLTETIPFKNKDPINIMTLVVVNKERPRFPSYAPHNLKSLIERCWDENPDNRPSFVEIFNMFLHKEVYYSQTNLYKIDAMGEYISKKTAGKL